MDVERTRYVVVGSQVVTDLVYVRQIQEAVHVDDGIAVVAKSRRRGFHDVPERTCSATFQETVAEVSRPFRECVPCHARERGSIVSTSPEISRKPSFLD